MPRRAAGTWGTVGGLIVAMPMLYLGFWGILAITVIGCLVGGYICGKTSDLMNVHDDPHIVFDEWVGIWIALLPSVWVWTIVWQNDHKSGWALINPSVSLLIIIPFILFRFFDVVKPFPIKWVDKNVSGGFGILIDDVLAGVMSAVVMIGFMVFGWGVYE